MRHLVLALAVGFALPALAQEPLFEALGQAPIVAGDRVRARERALDEALRQAVEQATATVLEPADLVARASDLKLRVYPKAKSYVANYRILDEGEQPPGTFQVHLSASVATGRQARDHSGTTASLPTLAGKKTRAVVCATVNGDGSDATQAADKALRELVAARRVDVVPGPQPCDAAGAAASVRSSGAQAAVTAEVQVTPAGDIRGTTLAAANAHAVVKLVEPDGRVSATGDSERGGYASAGPQAATAATRAAVVEAARTVDPILAQRFSVASGPSGGVLVRVTGMSRWAEYVALTRALGALPGVAAVEPRRFLRGEVQLLVRTASAAAQLAAHLNRVPPPGLRVGVRANGDTLELEVTGGDVVPERG